MPTVASAETGLVAPHRMKLSVIPSSGDTVEAMLCGVKIPANAEMDEQVSISLADVQHVLAEALRYGLDTKRDGALERRIQRIRQMALIQVTCRALYPLAVARHGEEEAMDMMRLLGGDSVQFDDEADAYACLDKITALMQETGTPLMLEGGD